MNIIIVVQRYGEEVTGGAELEARWLAERLQQYYNVSVVTSCALDYTSWENHFPPGKSEYNGVPLYRFPVDRQRNWENAAQASRKILFSPHSIEDEIQWMKQQGPYSTKLFEHLEEIYQENDIFIFFTYLYATTYFGLPLVAGKAILIPTAHEEPYLYLELFRSLFKMPQAIVYNTETERDIVHRALHNERVLSIVTGTGVNMPAKVNPDAFRQKYQLQGDYLLYVGRVSQSKNVPELVDFFIRFREERAQSLKLVIAGKSNIMLPTHPDIILTGYISEREKYNAIAGATALIIPSLYESLSIITLEAWLQKKPVIVNNKCEVTKRLCQKSNGGLYYDSYDEFSFIVNRFIADTSLCNKLGYHGYQYAQANYHWDIIIAKYRALFENLFPKP